jgi:hypothetical protein
VVRAGSSSARGRPTPDLQRRGTAGHTGSWRPEVVRQRAERRRGAPKHPNIRQPDRDPVPLSQCARRLPRQMPGTLDATILAIRRWESHSIDDATTQNRIWDLMGRLDRASDPQGVIAPRFARASYLRVVRPPVRGQARLCGVAHPSVGRVQRATPSFARRCLVASARPVRRNQPTDRNSAGRRHRRSVSWLP